MGYFDAVQLYITSICIHDIISIVGNIADKDCLAVLHIIQDKTLYKTLIRVMHPYIVNVHARTQTKFC